MGLRRKIKKHNREYLPDGGVLYRLYWRDMGDARSYAGLRRWLKSQGYINPKTGKPPSPMAPWLRMWRWALHAENFEEAYQLYNDVQRDSGKWTTKEQFKKFLDDIALTVFRLNPREYRAYQNGTY